jgi:hypothetical protein
VISLLHRFVVKFVLRCQQELPSACPEESQHGRRCCHTTNSSPNQEATLLILPRAEEHLRRWESCAA